jgi:hypothetical protein
MNIQLQKIDINSSASDAVINVVANQRAVNFNIGG